MSKLKRKKTETKENRVNVFLVPGTYDPIAQEPKHLRLLMKEEDFNLLKSQKSGIQFLPHRWLEHETMKYNLPFIFLGGHILGIIVPGNKLEKINSLRERAVLL